MSQVDVKKLKENINFNLKQGRKELYDGFVKELNQTIPELNQAVNILNGELVRLVITDFSEKRDKVNKKFQEIDLKIRKTLETQEKVFKEFPNAEFKKSGIEGADKIKEFKEVKSLKTKQKEGLASIFNTIRGNKELSKKDKEKLSKNIKKSDQEFKKKIEKLKRILKKGGVK